MNKEETNGYLKAVIIQLRAIENSLHELDSVGTFLPPVTDSIRPLKVSIINIGQKLDEIRSWNS
jgi:hypothetical protein